MSLFKNLSRELKLCFKPDKTGLRSNYDYSYLKQGRRNIAKSFEASNADPNCVKKPHSIEIPNFTIEKRATESSRQDDSECRFNCVQDCFKICFFLQKKNLFI